MKTFLILVCLMIGFYPAHAMAKSNTDKPSDRKTILLANPTERNIDIIRFLIGKKIFNVNLHQVQFIGVYHAGQSYDFSRSKEYINNNGLTWITLQEVNEHIGLSDVFIKNNCTPVFRELFDRSVGTIFFGGPDIQPEIYGEENLYSVVTDPVRHLFEVSFAFHLTGGSRNPDFVPFLTERPGYLVTGFCLGLQTMNVAAGGTLWQDIPAQVYGKNTPEQTLETDRNNLHRNYWQLIHTDDRLMSINFHPVQFTGHPFFGKTVRVRKKATPLIYSSHHQAPKDMGLGYEVTALSPDGKVVEAFAHNKYQNVFAVQFHPEVPALYEDMEYWKFEPGDEPQTFHQRIGKSGVRFHRNYWRHLSRIVSAL